MCVGFGNQISCEGLLVRLHIYESREAPFKKTGHSLPAGPHHIGRQKHLFITLGGTLNDVKTPMNACNSKVQLLACMGFFKNASEMGNIYVCMFVVPIFMERKNI